MKVVVLGASPNPERYSNKAIRQLKAHGHIVVPVHPAHKTIEGIAVVPNLGAVEGPVDTLTVYVGPQHIEPLLDDIVALDPKRVIINPGAESVMLRRRLEDTAIDHLETCTLVLLSTGQF